MNCRRRRCDAGICRQRFPASLLASLARYLKPHRYGLWHLSNEQHLLHEPWGCFLQGIKRSALPFDYTESKRGGSHNPLLTCSWLRPQVREELGELTRASTSTVSPRACTSGLNGEFWFNTLFIDLHDPASAPYPPRSEVLPQTWGCLADRTKDAAAHGYCTWDEAKLGCGHTEAALLGLLHPVSLWRGENEYWPNPATLPPPHLRPPNYLVGQPCHWPGAPR